MYLFVQHKGAKTRLQVVFMAGMLVLFPWALFGALKVEVVVQLGDRATSIAFSPNGRQILTGSADGTLQFWDAGTGWEFRQLRIILVDEFQTGGSNKVESVAFSPDGREALTGSEDGTARLWNIATGDLIRTLNCNEGVRPGTIDTAGNARGTPIRKGSSNAVYSVAFSPDGRQILTGSWDQTARLWDAATGREIRRFLGHTARVSSVAFSPDGRQILTGSWDQTARLWDIATGKEVRRFQDHTTVERRIPGGTEIYDPLINAVAFSPDFFAPQ